MENNELLIRMKEKDKDAILQFMHVHGERLYSRLLLRLGDRGLADKAFRDTIIGFYRTLTAGDSNDPVEALLFGYADRACEEILKDTLDAVIGDTLADAEVSARAISGTAVPDMDTVPAVFAEVQPEEASVAPAAEPEAPAQNGKTCSGGPAASRKGLFGLGVVVLSFGIAAVLWVILGLLMDMQLLPEFDLGYSWFSANIAPWF